MTIDEIYCVVYGAREHERERMKWEALQTYTILKALGGDNVESIDKVFPNLFTAEDLQPEHSVPAWKLHKEMMKLRTQQNKGVKH